MVILSMLATWAFFGIIVYLFMHNKVKLPTQKIIFIAMSGPVVWVFGSAIILLDFISEKVVEPIYIWLTKN
jgi:hypothetical protein